MTRSRKLFIVLTVGAFTAFLAIISVAVNTMRSEQTRVMYQGFDDHSKALLISVENQTRHLIESFDWPLLEKVQAATLGAEEVLSIWIEDDLSERVFGEPAGNLDNLDDTEYRTREIISNGDVIGSIHMVLSTSSLKESISRANRSAIAVIVASALFAGIAVLVFVYFRHRSGAKIREFESLVARTTEELQVNEELLSAVLENIPTAVVLRRPDGTILRINKEYERVFGLQNINVQGKQFSDIYPEDITKQSVEHDQKVLAEGRVYKSELRVQREDEIQFFDMLTFPIVDAEGAVIAIGNINHDITARERADRELQIALNDAEQANKAKSEFLANMSHELRTPLNAVIGYSQALQEETFGPVGSAKNKEYIDTINGAGDHLLNIIGDILDLSKVEAGEEVIVEEVLDVRKLIQECEIMTSERAAKKELRLVTLVDEDVHMFLADRLRVKQVLLNLISNSIKFTPPAGKITVHAYLQEDNCIIIKVSDTGVGIAPEELSSVMQPFAQAGDATTRSHEGSGLGLSLVQRMVELHNGEVSLQSTLGEGTSVSVRFPPERTITG